MKKMREPKPTLRAWDGDVNILDSQQYGPLCAVRLCDGTPAEARRLAAWLLRFADWADEVKFERKKPAVAKKAKV